MRTQDDSHKSNDVRPTVSTRMMTMTMPSTSPVATKKNSTLSDPSLISVPVGKNCAKDMDVPSLQSQKSFPMSSDFSM